MSSLRIAALAALVAVATASCPNDCSMHGQCNIYSACDCYRNWMGADCSQRVCQFGHAFVDTPQGDLNSDGRVDRPDIRMITLSTDVAWDSSYDSSPPVIGANVFIHSTAQTPTGVPSEANSLATIVAESVATENTGTGFTDFVLYVIPSDVTPNAALDSSFSDIVCAQISTVTPSTSYGDVGCDALIVDSTGASVAAFSGAALTTSAITPVSSTYHTQFTNTKTWELYPADHGKGKGSGNGLVSFWDEGHFYSECSGKGTCNRESGTCECYPGYSGAGCARTSCPNDCSGHGVCSRLKEVSTDASTGVAAYKYWDAVKTQQCVCDSGYTGIDCAQRICPSGDDPITRPATNTGSLSDTYWAVQPHAEGEEPEIQVFGHISQLDTAEPQPFALEFTDEFGDKWTTKTLDFNTATASDVEAAIEALPNNVVQDVQVSYAFFGVNADGSAHITDGVADVSYTIDGTCDALATSDTAPSGGCIGMPRSWAITFITNSGNIPSLSMRYSVVTAGGTTDSFDGTVSSIEFCASGNNCAVLGAAGSGSGTEDLHIASVLLGWAAVGDTDGTGEAVYRSSTDGESTVVVTNDDSVHVFLNTGREGSQENAICSNRGICDYESGLCKCFNGFTDDDCSVQNALAMY